MTNPTNPEFFAPWQVNFGDGQISPRRLQLLQAIHNSGSVSQAAKQIGMTYKAAWDAVEIINNLAGQNLVDRQHGGKGGGGATLTETGLKILATYEKLSKLQTKWLAELGEGSADVLPILRRIKMQTSARNSFFGLVEKIQAGQVNHEITLKLAGDDKIVATVTSDSVDRMNLKPGAEAYAIIKASWVVLAKPEVKNSISARNFLCGKVQQITEGPVNVEVNIELPGKNVITSIITKDSLQELGLKTGEKVCAMIKASHVLVGIDD